MIPASIVFAFVAAAVGLAGGYGLGRTTASAEIQRLRAAHAEEKAKAVQAASQQAKEERRNEQRWTARLVENMDAAHLQAADARSAAARADAAAQQLRHAYLTVAAALGRAGEGAAAAGSGQAATGPGLVLTDVLGWADTRLRGCAAALDQARIAGLACERAYDEVAGSRPLSQQGVQAATGLMTGN